MPVQAEINCLSRPVRDHLEGALDSYFADISSRRELASRQIRLYEDMIRTRDFEMHIIPIHGEEHARELIDLESYIVQDSDRILSEIGVVREIVAAAPDCVGNGAVDEYFVPYESYMHN